MAGLSCRDLEWTTKVPCVRISLSKSRRKSENRHTLVWYFSLQLSEFQIISLELLDTKMQRNNVSLVL